MGKKKIKNEKVKEATKKAAAQIIEENSNLYGGLPSRDLKKNLGCG